MAISQKLLRRRVRHRRIRAKVKGTAQRPRFSVFRSNKFIYVQLIDDERGKTLLAAGSRDIKKPKAGKSSVDKSAKVGEEEGKPLSGKTGIAFEVGKLIAKRALEKNIKEAIFDRGGYKYHGRVKAIAEGAKEGGLKF